MREGRGGAALEQPIDRFDLDGAFHGSLIAAELGNCGDNPAFAADECWEIIDQNQAWRDFCFQH